MKNKKKISLLIFSVIIFLSFFSKNALAEDFEKARVNAHYKNPVTGEIDDPGNNYGIGQGMVENLLYKEAEVIYNREDITVKVKYLMKNYLSNYKIELMQSDGSFREIPFTVEDYSKDIDLLTFNIPSEDEVIRARAFVEPMGREVVFFYNFSDFTKSAVLSQKNEDKNESGIVKRADEINLNISENLNNINSETLVNENTEKADNKEIIPKEHGLLLKDSKELKMYLNNGIIKKEKKEEVKKVSLGPVTKIFINGFITFLFVFMAIIFSFAILIRYIAKSLEKFNRKLEEKLYEDE